MACGASTDPSSLGRICAPGTSNCPDSVQLTRSYPGRNILDVSVRNRGPAATVSVLIGSPNVTFPTNDVGADASADTGPSDPDLPTGTILRRYVLDSGESTSDRFTTTQILTRNTLRISIACTPCPDCTDGCDASLQFVRLTESLDCESNDDCSGDRLCDPNLGACVECLDDEDCRVEQRCNSTNGRCVPPIGSGGCRTIGGQNATGFFLLTLLMFVVALASRARRRSAIHLVCMIALATGIVGFTLTTAPRDAQAQGIRSTLSLDAGLRFPTGKLGNLVKRGIGIGLRETLRGRHVGATASIETSYFLTTQPAPPFTRELQMYAFSLGPRGFIPVGSVELAVGADYRRVGLGPNSLVNYTGLSPNYHGLAASLGARYEFRGFEASATVGWRPTFDLEFNVVSVNLGIGVTSR